MSRPHAYLVTKSRVPSQIVVCGLTGGPDRWLGIRLDLNRPPLTYSAQALAIAKRNPTVPFFGRVNGYVVNFSPDHAVAFDLSGHPVERYDKAYVPGVIQIFSGGREVGPRLTAMTVSREQGGK